jgi:exopolyphosphatase/guanosine-5'-triphosphate,3'-diphosphate pyrophosphatase
MGKGLSIRDSFSRIVRLGEGISSNGVLSEAAMKRTLDALKLCQKKLQKHGNPKGRFVATEACRKAGNADHFVQRVRKEAGIELDIITNEEEAELAFHGCSSLLKPEVEHALVFDIGGGSTEFMWAKIDHGDGSGPMANKHTILDWLSLDRGVMNLSEKFGGNAYAEAYFDELVEEVKKRLQVFEEKNQIMQMIESRSVQLLSTSGTVTTLAAVHKDLKKYERSKIDGITMPIGDIRAVIERLLSMSPSARLRHPCIGVDRCDYIISGCAIVEAVARLWPIKAITIADRGVREGIIISLMRDAYHG